MKKVIRDGKVAVLYSPRFGAGWHSWGAPIEMLFDPEVVALVENNQREKITPALEARGYKFYMGGADDLQIEWMPEGTRFKVSEYDGYESIEYKDADDWITA